MSAPIAFLVGILVGAALVMAIAARASIPRGGDYEP